MTIELEERGSENVTSPGRVWVCGCAGCPRSSARTGVANDGRGAFPPPRAGRERSEIRKRFPPNLPFRSAHVEKGEAGTRQTVPRRKAQKHTRRYHGSEGVTRRGHGQAGCGCEISRRGRDERWSREAVLLLELHTHTHRSPVLRPDCRSCLAWVTRRRKRSHASADLEAGRREENVSGGLHSANARLHRAV